MKQDKIKPMLFSVMKNYDGKKFIKDVVAGIIVAIIALPLSIVAGIIAKKGMDGLVIATIIAGIILVLMGVFRLGGLIKYIPYTITTGFTAGIAVTILIGQM